MNPVYEYNRQTVEIVEKDNGEDKEFNFKLLDKSLEEHIHNVRNFFEENDVYTDVLFYTHSDHTYQIIVKEEYYTEFLLKLFKEKLIQQIRWV